MKRSLPIPTLLLLAALLVPHPVGAQTGALLRMPRPDQMPMRPLGPPPEPVELLLAEFPELKDNLSLQGEAAVALQAFERDLRDLAGIAERQRRLPAGTVISAAGINLPGYLDYQLDEQSQRVDTLRDLQQSTKALWALLDERQRALLNRRLEQAVLKSRSNIGPEALERPPRR